MPPALKKLTAKPLRAFGLDERWLQQQIDRDPSLLNLGDLSVLHRERWQHSSGRLDFLMEEPETGRRYAIELMLGATDPSHIVRCIEYWDRERQIHPKLEHCAVIVAEKITARFFNVIRLLNRSVPMIAVQFSALELGNNEMALQFVKVLDESVTFGEEEGDTPAEPATLSFWESKASQDSFAAAEHFISLVGRVVPSTQVSYRKNNIAISSIGRQFIWLRPGQRRHCHIQLSVGEDHQQDMLELLDNDNLAANARGLRTIVVQMTASDISAHEKVLREVIELCARLSTGVDPLDEERG